MTEKPDIERRKLLRSAAVAGAVLGATSSAQAQASQLAPDKPALPGLGAFESQLRQT